MSNAGAEFRDDARPIATPATPAAPAAPGGPAGSGNAAARKWLSSEQLAPLTTLSTGKALASLGLTIGLLAALIATGIWAWGQGAWLIVALCIIGIGIQQHAIFILNHEAAHQRLLPHRKLNDALGSLIGMSGGVSMHTYRVTHRLHHNHLYGKQDPDTAIHGGYPRGRKYLVKKLLQDLIGLNAWKTYAYFFGAPAINDDTGSAINPLNDTSPDLRRAARADRVRVVVFQIGVPTTLFLIATYAYFTRTEGLFALKLLGFYALFWLLPLVTVLQPILRLRAICEHGAVTDLSSPLTAARCVRTWGSVGNWIGRAVLFPHHVNHHLEHHLYPAVPHYHLPKLHALLLAKGALQGAQVRDVVETLRDIFAPRRQAKLLSAA